MIREERIEFAKKEMQSSVDAESLMYEALKKMAEAGVTPRDAVAIMFRQGFNHLHQISCPNDILDLVGICQIHLSDFVGIFEELGFNMSAYQYLKLSDTNAPTDA